MRRFLVASHGNLASGMVNTVQIFTGELDSLSHLCAYIDHQDIHKQITAYFQKVQDNDEVVVFTDLMGGSVNTAFLAYLKRPHTHLITGFNLSLILEFLFLSEEYLTVEQIETIVGQASGNIIYMNHYSVSFDENDDI